MKSGDVIKFGRVLFRVKENSVQLNNSDWEDSFGMDEASRSTPLKKNLTDVDSADLERDLNIAKAEGDDESAKYI